jgi:two-component system chemotaxis sensor kinase CheA
MMDELLDQFLIEGRELVQRASEDLLALEREPTNSDRLDSLFRAIHTLKGSVGLFDFASMHVVLSAIEDLLGAVRDGRSALNKAVVDALLECMGDFDIWLDAVAASGGLPPDAATRASQMAAALSGTPSSGEEPREAAGATGQDWADALLASDPELSAKIAGRPVTAVHYVPTADCFFLGDDPIKLVRSIPDLIFLDIEPREPWSLDNFDPFACNLSIKLISGAPAEDIRRLFRFVADQIAIAEITPRPTEQRNAINPAAAAEMTSGRDSRILRVDAARIDALVDLVGEMIVAKNGLADLVARAGQVDVELARALYACQSHIERLVGEMHRAVIATRMTPFAESFRRFPRLVREIAGKLGKSVRFEIVGAETEADKSVVDGLFEPLLHILRNAVDHGIEDEQTRGAAGKPASGRITLSASQEGDRILITVRDDGAGIDPAAVRRAALARGLMNESALAAMDDEGILGLIFTAGFSTASTVSDISGRGVGMDAVRAAVEGFGGRVGVSSAPGAGSTVRLSLPRAVAISTVIVVRQGQEQFGVPIEIVEETARIPRGRIHPIRDGAAFVLRDRTIPLLRLEELLNLPATPQSSNDARVLILAMGDQRVGVEVDSFAERIDVLLRPMSGLLAGVPGVTGTTLLGDGQVMMVLNLPELVA